MSRSVKAAAVQFNISPGDIDSNLSYVRAEIERLAGEGVRLVLLPEMWATGFDYKQLNELAKRSAEVVEELGELSRRHGMVVIGSLPEPHEDKVYNTAYVLDGGRVAGGEWKKQRFSST